MASAVMNIARIPGAAAESGTVREKYVEITFTAVGDTYVTGGFTIDPKSCGLLEILSYEELSFALVAGTAQTGTWLTKFDFKTGKLQFFTAAAAPGTTVALVEAGAAVVVGVFVIRARVCGRA